MSEWRPAWGRLVNYIEQRDYREPQLAGLATRKARPTDSFCPHYAWTSTTLKVSVTFAVNKRPRPHYTMVVSAFLPSQGEQCHRHPSVWTKIAFDVVIVYELHSPPTVPSSAVTPPLRRVSQRPEVCCASPARPAQSGRPSKVKHTTSTACQPSKVMSAASWWPAGARPNNSLRF
jgi:hypothetical protein